MELCAALTSGDYRVHRGTDYRTVVLITALPTRQYTHKKKTASCRKRKRYALTHRTAPVWSPVQPCDPARPENKPEQGACPTVATRRATRAANVASAASPVAPRHALSRVVGGQHAGGNEAGVVGVSERLAVGAREAVHAEREEAQPVQPIAHPRRRVPPAQVAQGGRWRSKMLT